MPKSSGTPKVAFSPSQIDWCRKQQRAALEHMRPVIVCIGHGAWLMPHCCDHPQCCSENNERWLLDAFAEEIELLPCPVIATSAAISKK